MEVDVIATAFGISGSDRAVISSDLAQAFEPAIELNDRRSRNIQLPVLKSVQLFEEFGRTLTAEPPAFISRRASAIGRLERALAQ